MTDQTPTLTCDEIRDLAAPFVLGALADGEAESVRAHIASCPELHAELVDFASVLPILAASAPVVEPPAGLKARLLAAAAADLAQAPTVPAPPFMPAAPIESAAPKVPEAPIAFPSASEREERRVRRSSSPGTWLLRIAAVLAIGLLGGWNVLLQGQLGEARTYEQSVASVLVTASQRGALTAILRPSEGHGAGLAAVAADGSVALAMRDLAPTAGSTVYEAWVIAGDGVPHPLGSFTVGTNGTAYFEAKGSPVEASLILAVTREPRAGAQTPNLPIVSSGTATTEG